MASSPDRKPHAGASAAAPIELDTELAKLRCFEGRASTTPADAMAESFARLAAYRDGAIFIACYSGASEWERHGRGDEVVLVIDGVTTLILLEEGDWERRVDMKANSLFVVPQGTWHRFESPAGVKVLTVTPQPTDHRVQSPARSCD